jgi:hypothetical protein
VAIAEEFLTKENQHIENDLYFVVEHDLLAVDMHMKEELGDFKLKTEVLRSTHDQLLYDEVRNHDLADVLRVGIALLATSSQKIYNCCGV